MIAMAPPSAVAQESSVSIVAPETVKPGATFKVRAQLNVAGPDEAFITGGFLDFDGTRLAPTKRRCSATPAGTFAGDTPQSPQFPGQSAHVVRVRNSVRRSGTLRFCLWVINARTYEVEAAGARYIKALAKPKPRRHPKAVAKPQRFSGRTNRGRLPIRFTTANRQIRALTYTANFRCSDGLTVQWATRLPDFAFGRDGRFKVSPPPIGTVNDAVKISGRVAGRRVTGTFSEKYTSVLGNTCTSGAVKFSASAPRNR
jgi:hypothetical protein